jgi:hypothetical protein
LFCSALLLTAEPGGSSAADAAAADDDAAADADDDDDADDDADDDDDAEADDGDRFQSLPRGEPKVKVSRGVLLPRYCSRPEWSPVFCFLSALSKPPAGAAGERPEEGSTIEPPTPDGWLICARPTRPPRPPRGGAIPARCEIPAQECLVSISRRALDTTRLDK